MQPLLSEGAGPTPATKHHDRAPGVGLKAQALPSRWPETRHTGPGDKSPTNLDSMSRLAASAYLKSRRLASSRNLIRDNLGQRAGSEPDYPGLGTHTKRLGSAGLAGGHT